MRIDGLSEIAGQFDAMLIDQYGIIHDGQALYSGTLDVMDQLRARGMPVVIMTNSGKRAAANRDRILRMGLSSDHFLGVISSGEVAYARLRGKRAFLIGRKGEDYGFEGVTFVDNPQHAEVLLILGTNYPETSLDDYRRLFSSVVVPAYCCNPDKLMLTRDGLMPAPGALAAMYEEMGRQVVWVGKPYPEIYWAAKQRLGNPDRILCIGDSAEHDVAGGRAAGFGTLLVMTGVSAGLDPLHVSPRPDWIADAFVW